MHTLIFITAFGFAAAVFAGEASVPAVTISAKDVVQTSVKVYHIGGGTNGLVVKWVYTEDGAKKIRAFEDAHVGQKVQMQIGSFVSDFTIRDPNHVGRDGVYTLSERDAKLVEAGLRGK